MPPPVPSPEVSGRLDLLWGRAGTRLSVERVDSMCGISGELHLDSAQPVERGVLERMSAVLAHRGPDGAGIYCDGPVGLTYR